MSKRADIIAYAVATAGGAAAWLLTLALSGRREAWDASGYYVYGVPALFLLALLLGVYNPRHAWRWGIATGMGQIIVAVAQNPTGNLLPLGLVVFLALSLPAVLGGFLGGYLGQRYRRDGSDTPLA